MIAFTTTDLNKIFRREVADPLEGVDATEPDSENLWKEDEIYQYMTEALDQVSKGTGGRYRVYQFPVVAGQATIGIPRALLNIRSARLLTAKVTVQEANANDYLFRVRDDYNKPLIGAQGMFDATGSPSDCYIRDYDANQIRLVPIPATDDTLEIQCDVTDNFLYAADYPLPFQDAEDQRLVLHYMKFLAYLKHDADAENLPRSTLFKGLYETGVAERESRLRNYRRAPGAVRMDW